MVVRNIIYLKVAHKITIIRQKLGREKFGGMAQFL